jgi:hypothetical protein
MQSHSALTECEACNGGGYLFISFSSGLKTDDVYNEPHIERCDACMRFPTDSLALKYVCQQAVAQTN